MKEFEFQYGLVRILLVYMQTAVLDLDLDRVKKTGPFPLLK